MKITCSKRDDVLKRKKEYEEDFAKRKEEYNQDYRNYRMVLQNQYDDVEEKIRSILGSLADGLNIDVETGWQRGLEVRISNDENTNNQKIALSWHYSVKLRENGEVVKETGSWSGLQAITSDQIKDLQKSVAALEAINSIDWKELMDVPTPDYRDYVKHSDPQYDKDKPNFDKMLFEADMEEAQGKNILFHKAGSRNSLDQYYKIISETPKNYNVIEIAPWYIQNEDMRQGKSIEDIVKDYMKWSVKRIDKDKLRNELGKDYETFEY